MNKVLLNFFPDSNLFYEVKESNLYLNIFAISKIQNIKNKVSEIISSENFQDYVFVNSFQILYKNYRQHIISDYISDDEIIFLKHAIAEVILFFMNKPSESWLPSDAITYNPSFKNAVRYGNVELRVLESWLRDAESLYMTGIQLSKEMESGKFNLIEKKEGFDKWFSCDDLRYNLQAFMTNAGFYLPENQNHVAHEIGYWCNLYMDELKQSAIFAFPPAYPFFLQTAKALSIAKKPPIDLNFPSPSDFYKLLKNKNILFVTPFALKIENLFSTGKIFNLFKDIEIPKFEITTIESPVSTYPYRPHGSWSETYLYLTDKISKKLDNGDYDIFIASSGCYGLPLCGYVRKKYGINTLYYGNHINTLFGILQNCSQDFLSESRIIENWDTSDLGERYPNMKSIDNGRYI